jgi:hypothetical protein
MKKGSKEKEHTVRRVSGLVDIGARVDVLACGLDERAATPEGLEQTEMRIYASNECGGGEEGFRQHLQVKRTSKATHTHTKKEREKTR